ncbi:transposon Ty3-I Gag-Pol polyprotein [Trichonephila clavipes]|nr:transposon Ty3-I Gag-Pol polyprotein [Trichonephila clavipes]
MDYLSRFVVTKALSTAVAEEVAKIIIEEIVLKHGEPRTIITYHDKVFELKLVTELRQLCSSKHSKMTGYLPQTNGLTESFNKTLADMLLMYVEVEQTNWNEILPRNTKTIEAQERILTNDTKKLPSNAPVSVYKRDTTLDSTGEIVPYG